MIPEKLRIQGLYSYQSSQTIDFKKLLQDGIFGIFGNVGSGKSSILEAMTLALYNTIERISTREDRNYNLMNLKSNRLEIDFEFSAKGERYRIEVRGNRNKKDFSKVETYQNTVYIYQDGGWRGIQKTGEEILGLSYENFKKTIIIPQGKFLEFLNLAARERTEMLQELFNLDKYDLSEKVKIQEQRLEGNLKEIQGNLQELVNITVEELEKVKSELEKLSKKQIYLQEQIVKLEDQKAQLERLEQIQKNIENWKKELDKLESKKQEIKKLQEELKEYQSFKEKFAEIFRQLEKLKEENQSYQEEINELYQAKENLITQQTQIQSEYQKVQKDYQNISKYQKELEGWQNAKIYLQTQVNLKTFQKESQEIEAKLKTINTQIHNDQDQRTNLLNQMKDIREKIKSLEQLLQEEVQLAEKITIKKEWKKNIQKKENLELEIQEYFQDIIREIEEVYNQKILTQELEPFLEEKSKQIQNIKEKQKELNFQLKLKEFSENLKVGEICPLCGGKIKSLEHLKKYGIENKNLISEYEIQTNNYENIKARFELNKKLIEEKKKEILSIETSINSYSSSLPTQEDLNKYNKIIENKDIYKDLRIKQEDLEKTLGEFEKKIELHREDLRNIEQIWQEISLNLKQAETTLTLLQGQITQEILEEAKSLTISELEAKIQEKEKFTSNIQVNYTNLTSHVKQLETHLIQLTTKIEEKEKLIRGLQEREKNLQETLSEKVKEHRNISIEYIQTVLDRELNEIEILEQINKYFIQKEKLKELIDEEESKVQDFVVCIQEKDQLIVQLENYKQEFQSLNQNLGSLKSKQQNLEQGVKRKKELETQKNALESKKERVEILKKLFEGKGFVNYVSTIFLRDLCESANERFYSFTANRLRLELNEEKNVIHVRDLYNDGKYRHIKTLSGGQLFQASLAMALALSDRIQMGVETKERFFFLDEGFGSLDKDSLAVVFETLKALRKENRIVGIISHVEEMKSEIRTYLSVTNSSQTGSKIQPSWEKKKN